MSKRPTRKLTQWSNTISTLAAITQGEDTTFLLIWLQRRQETSIRIPYFYHLGLHQMARGGRSTRKLTSLSTQQFETSPLLSGDWTKHMAASIQTTTMRHF